MITYKGQSPEKVGRVQYEIKNNDKFPLSSSGLATLDHDLQIRAGGSCSKCPLEALEDDEWTLTITWDKQTETIHMPKQSEGERIMGRSFEPMRALSQVGGIVFIVLIGYIVYRFVKK
ncbi:hypothetical protein [Aneurinibacillus soli]|uniref:Uncharacterized protein n=1 Tax=Aneurinibacillus soli TaxID=1500254 RepID=A0A0U4WAX8_9BACL|nr:hypothetical protein [Aneurinibacillus soli]BAU26041.1 hypothetical protein CB4_00113 [Aneurinibacillus soli]